VVAAVAVVLVIDGEALAMAGRSLADEAPTALRLVELSVLLGGDPVGRLGAPRVGAVPLVLAASSVVGDASRRARATVRRGTRSCHTLGDAVFAYDLGHAGQAITGAVL
jgi:hypothetical protein